jgi:hypothetical protein
MLKNLRLSSLLRTWHSLNGELILNESIPNDLRLQLIQDRKIYSEIFLAMEGSINEKYSK